MISEPALDELGGGLMILTGQFYRGDCGHLLKEPAVGKDGKSQQIMQAAERLFTSRRFHEITMDDVAREAGVGKGTIYRYFQDKDDLFFRTATSGFDELCDLLWRKVPGNASFAQQLLIACRQISRFFERRRQLSRMMQTEEGRVSWGSGQLHQHWMDHRKGLVAAVADMIRKGVAEGEVREDIAPEVLANYLLGMLRTRGRDLCDAPQAMRQHEVVVELFCRGAGRRCGGLGRDVPTDATAVRAQGTGGDGRAAREAEA
jgi:TetR/AcrR family fatty acid metabolism transcriptional regulator